MEDLEIVPSEIMAYAVGQKRKAGIKIRNTFFGIAGGFLLYSIWGLAEKEVALFFVMLAMAAFFLLLAVTFRRRIPKKEEIDAIATVADKMETGIEPSDCRYLFFVKEQKWGIYDYKFRRVLLPAQYDSICWEKKGRIAIGKSGDKAWRVDVKNAENRVEVA